MNEDVTFIHVFNPNKSSGSFGFSLFHITWFNSVVYRARVPIHPYFSMIVEPWGHLRTRVTRNLPETFRNVCKVKTNPPTLKLTARTTERHAAQHSGLTLEKHRRIFNKSILQKNLCLNVMHDIVMTQS